MDLYEGERLFETFGNNKQKMVIVAKLVDEMIQGKYSKEKRPKMEPKGTPVYLLHSRGKGIPLRRDDKKRAQSPEIWGFQRHQKRKLKWPLDLASRH